ncbi:MAG: orotidine-5'-phosphate decarboxylase [Gammaproteobacteria bacterium]
MACLVLEACGGFLLLLLLAALGRCCRQGRAAVGEGEGRPLLIAVTVLTSLGQEDLAELGMSGEPRDHVIRLASLARDSGLDGVVCSAREVTDLRSALGDAFTLVTPGIRPAGSDVGDQRRVMTPAEAIAAGSSYLVIGRPVVQAEDPVETLRGINATIA